MHFALKTKSKSTRHDKKKTSTERRIMKPIEQSSPETQSADLVGSNLEALKQLFPEAFTEGKIDFEVLKQLLGGAVDERAEKYGLNWHGKRQARQLALTPSTGTLRPAPEDSVDWDTTQNLMIEGDNLEVLKLLQKSYAGKVKMIYIDPPYNTGKDFVYPDNFKDTIGNYLSLTGQIDGSGRRTISNVEASGRFHTDWLNMIYPRLMLARNVLSDEGVIFISIGDDEVDELQSVCKQIFGEENFIANAVWEKKNKAAFLSKDLSTMKDYILIYAKSKSAFHGLIGQIVTEEETYPCVNAGNKREQRLIPSGIMSKYANANAEFPGGSRISAGTMDIVFLDPLILVGGRVSMPVRMEGNWRYTQDAMDIFAKAGDLYLTQELYLRRIVREPREKLFRDLLPRTGTSGRPAGTRIDPDDLYVDGWGTNEDANEELRMLLDEQNVLEYPKPVTLIEKLIAAIRDPSALVLDFFAGSGTAGEACMRLNEIDSGNRKFILVQLPQPVEHERYKTIAEITRAC